MTNGERLDAEIAALQASQDTLKEGQKKQLPVVELTLEVFNHTCRASHCNLQKLFTMVRNVNDYFVNHTQALSQRQHCDECLALIEATIESYLQKIGKMDEVFANVATGSIGASMVPPAMLTTYLTNALRDLPRGSSLPLPVARENAAAILRLFTARAYRKEQVVTLGLEIPLIGSSEFAVNWICPLPRRGKNNTYYYIETTEDVAVVNRENRLFLHMTLHDLDSCKHDENRHYCQSRFPVMAFNEDSPCSIWLYTDGVISHRQRCPKKMVMLIHSLKIDLRSSSGGCTYPPKLKK